MATGMAWPAKANRGLSVAFVAAGVALEALGTAGTEPPTVWMPRSAGGPWPGAPGSRKTGLRSHRHRQPHGSGPLGQLERHETLDPVRSSAVEPRFHWVRQRAELHDELTLTGHTELVVLM